MLGGTGARGWRRVTGSGIAAWAAAAWPVAREAVAGSGLPWRCGGTWFVGLDALPNGPDGRMGEAEFPWQEVGLEPVPLHPAQLSVTREGYPRQGEEESESEDGKVEVALGKHPFPQSWNVEGGKQWHDHDQQVGDRDREPALHVTAQEIHRAGCGECEECRDHEPADRLPEQVDQVEREYDRNCDQDCPQNRRRSRAFGLHLTGQS